MAKSYSATGPSESWRLQIVTTHYTCPEIKKPKYFCHCEEGGFATDEAIPAYMRDCFGSPRNDSEGLLQIRLHDFKRFAIVLTSVLLFVSALTGTKKHK